VAATLRDGSGFGVVGWRQQRLNLHEAVQAGALGVREVVEALGVQDGLALRGREFAEAAEGAIYVAALVGREIEELLEGGADLLALRRCEVLHPLVVFEQALALFGRHGVELGEAIEQALLRLRRIEVEAGLGL